MISLAVQRQSSKDIQDQLVNNRRSHGSDKAPSLPREGAQQAARKINKAINNNNNDFMKTPDPGVAG